MVAEILDFSSELKRSIWVICFLYDLELELFYPCLYFLRSERGLSIGNLIDDLRSELCRYDACCSLLLKSRIQETAREAEECYYPIDRITEDVS